ncbi:MAG: DUF4926 domain-containing protein [Rhodothermales bacterium]
MREHDRVVLTADLPVHGLQAGGVGTIVHACATEPASPASDASGRSELIRRERLANAGSREEASDRNLRQAGSASSCRTVEECFGGVWCHVPRFGVGSVPYAGCRRCLDRRTR